MKPAPIHIDRSRIGVGVAEVAERQYRQDKRQRTGEKQRERRVAADRGKANAKNTSANPLISR